MHYGSAMAKARTSKAKKQKPETVLVLRTCGPDLSSYGGFRWKDKGLVVSPDWHPGANCGNGLHGLLWGEGTGELLSWELDSKWLVVEVEASKVVELNGKVKFPEGQVIYCGDRLGATSLIANHRPGMVVGATVTVGDKLGALTGYRGTSTSGYRGTSTSGNCGTSTSGNYGTSTSGNYGTSTSGEGGTSTSGNYGTSTSGYRGTSTSGEGGIIELTHWDGKRYRKVIGYIGEDGLLPDVPYILDSNGKIMRKP